MNDTLIRMEGISKKFKIKEVLKDLSFSIERGSVTGLLGKNGVGKSTLIKCALGLLRPQAGRITVCGEDVWDLSEGIKEKIGYVPQTSGFYAWLTVQEMIEYTASFYPQWDKDLVEQLIRDWDMGNSLKEKAVSISEGLAQRLSIILALGHQPSLLILDEPVANLDPGARRTFLKTIIDTVADRECTVLFSSHITSDLERVADRVAILDQGKIKLTMELAQLKDEIKRLKLLSRASLPQSLDVPGLLRSRISDGEAIVYVRQYSPGLKTRIENQYQCQVDVEDLNLEEIFVELT